MMTTAAMPHRMDRDVHLHAGVSRVDLPHADHVGHESVQTDDRRGDRDALRPGQHPGGRIHEGGMDPPEPPAMKGVGRAMFGGPPVVAVFARELESPRRCMGNGRHTPDATGA